MANVKDISIECSSINSDMVMIAISPFESVGISLADLKNRALNGSYDRNELLFSNIAIRLAGLDIDWNNLADVALKIKGIQKVHRDSQSMQKMDAIS